MVNLIVRFAFQVGNTDEMIKVAFLFDKFNDWIVTHFPNKLDKLRRYEFHKIYDEQNLHGFDIVFVLGYTKILKKEVLDSNKLMLAVHESDLPNGKGFAPLQWQILEGKNKRALESEFKEWIDSIECNDKKYDILYINKID